MPFKLLSTLALASCFGASLAQITASTHASGLSRPITVAAPKGDSRLFVVEQRQSTTGRIRVLNSAGTSLGTYLSVTSVATGNEQGLLGIAFHPNFATNGYFYVNYTASGAGTTRIVRYTATGGNAASNTADLTTALPIMTISQPFSNHNGGSLKFGPDGYLYIGTGDGGSSNDPNNNSQNVNSLLGKFLRIDVDRDDYPVDTNKNYGIPSTNPYAVSGGAPEVWSIGWRNPWQYSLDTSDFGGFNGWFVADVGQNAWEEVSYERPGAPAGLNYGWRVKEGFTTTGLGGGTGPFVDPIYVYDHGVGLSISGGTLYRGTSLGPAMYGRYFFCDYITGELWSLKIDFSSTFTADPSDFKNHLPVGNMTSIMADSSGELYAGTTGSVVYRFNGSGVPVTGQVIFNDLVPAAARPRRVTMVLRDTGTSQEYNFDLMLDAAGNFRVPALVGNFELSVKTGQWLRKKVSFTTTSSGASGVNLSLVNGNCNRDTVIDLSDYTIVADAFNALPADPNWNVQADLNEDGVIDLTDYTIIAVNFNELDD